MRTSKGMLALSAAEATQLRDRLRQAPAAESVSGTIAVAANASTSVTLTRREKVAAVLGGALGMAERTGGQLGEGFVAIRDALRA